jgi:hypothetical protein
VEQRGHVVAHFRFLGQRAETTAHSEFLTHPPKAVIFVGHKSSDVVNFDTS